MNPSTAFESIPTWGILVILFPVAAYALQMACNTCGADTPAFRKSLFVTLVAGGAAFFTFDVLGYFLVLSTRDMTHLNAPTTYLHWLPEPLYLKWQAMGLVPVLRYLPVAFAVCLAGILYTLMLKDHFRIVMVVFLMQWVLAVIITSVLAFAINNVLRFALPATSQPTPPTEQTTPAPRATRPYPRKPGSGQAPTPPPPATPEAGQTQVNLKDVLSRYNANLSPYLEKLHVQLEELHQALDPYIEPVKEAAAPYTQHLPPVVQEFLDDGGWPWVLLGLGGVGLLSVYSTWSRFRAALQRKKRRKKKLLTATEIDLEDISHAFNDPGKNQVAVRGFPGRLRLVVMAPASSYVGDLLPEMSESLLDWIRPGLGEIYENDCPRVVVWPRISSEGRFTALVSGGILIPEERGRKTPWIVMSGTTHLGRQRIYLALAVFLDRPGYIREIQVSREGWSELVTIQPATAD
ncbi:MAG: hypothetical protein U0840_21010 [Gemmataceae bacterium]